MGRQPFGQPDPRLLYLAEAPLTAEDIAATLGMARSNVSNSLKELLAWNLIRRVPIKGDRRDHFEAETDIWEVFRASRPAARNARSIPPSRCSRLRRGAGRDPGISEVASRRLKEMLAFMELMDGWYSQMLTVPRPSLVALIRLGARVVSFLPAAKDEIGADGRIGSARCVSKNHPASTQPRSTLALGDVRFRALMAEADWGRLPLPIRRRFSKRLAGGETAVYVGEIEETTQPAGWLLARPRA